MVSVLVFYDWINTKIKSITQLSNDYTQEEKHSDLQNTKHTCIQLTQKYIRMTLHCNSKALTVKLPHI